MKNEIQPIIAHVFNIEKINEHLISKTIHSIHPIYRVEIIVTNSVTYTRYLRAEHFYTLLQDAIKCANDFTLRG